MKKRYAQVGLGGRSRMYYAAVVKDFKECSEMVGLCDVNQGRMHFANNQMLALGGKALPMYAPQQFDEMIAQTKPNVVIVTSGPDATHSQYIIRAMELGCDVITEKPMTVDEHRCREILETQQRTGRSIRVTFNYRYAPPRSQIREMISEGVIGRVLSIDFAWLLDTRHGADYFRRWHRYRKNGGSLLVHKSTHHFDLVNWWLQDWPEEVFCHASRSYYTSQHGDELGLRDRGERCLTCGVNKKCRFYMDLSEVPLIKQLYLDNEKEDGYFRDRCIFDDSINIWDNMSVSVKYRKGAILNYMLHAYSPYEGYRIAFNGTKGRIEHAACEKTYINGDGEIPGELKKDATSITLIPEFSSAKIIEPRTGTGGHGGGDPVLLNDLFNPAAPVDPLKRAANEIDGAYSILVGIAAYRSIDASRSIRVPELVGDILS